MACEPQFTKGLNFECIMSIVNDVRTGAITTATASKAIWTIGCGLAAITNSDKLIVASDDGMSDETKETLCNQLENLCAPQSGPMDDLSIEIAIRILMTILRNWIL